MDQLNQEEKILRIWKKKRLWLEFWTFSLSLRTIFLWGGGVKGTLLQRKKMKELKRKKWVNLGTFLANVLRPKKKFSYFARERAY